MFHLVFANTCLRLGNAYHVNWYIKTGCYIALFVVEYEVIHHDLKINLVNIHSNANIYAFN